MSPAALTEMPERSPAATPESLKPVVPSRLARLRLAGKAARRRRVFPEHHVARAGSPTPSAGAIRPDNQVRYSVAVDVPGRAHRGARNVTGHRPRELEAGGAIEGRELEVGREGARRGRVLPKHHVASTEGRRRSGSASSAPIIRSATPSPLMSPAALTEKPERS